MSNLEEDSFISKWVQMINLLIYRFLKTTSFSNISSSDYCHPLSVVSGHVLSTVLDQLICNHPKTVLSLPHSSGA